jgi:hypothetical protein
MVGSNKLLVHLVMGYVAITRRFTISSGSAILFFCYR